MLTTKELDNARNRIDRCRCVWNEHFGTNCSSVIKIRYCSKYKRYSPVIQHMCSKHIAPYKRKFEGIEVITLSVKELFYLKIKC